MPGEERFELDLHAQRVLFGAGRIDDVPDEVDALGMRQVMLVATRSAKSAADRISPNRDIQNLLVGAGQVSSSRHIAILCP